MNEKLIIFNNMTDKENEAALKFLQAYEKNFSKGAVIFSAGDTIDEMGFVLEGRVIIESGARENRNILNIIETGEFFGATYAILNAPALVDAVAGKDCRILFMKAGLLSLNNDTLYAKKWAYKLFQNFLKTALDKNLRLSCRSAHTSPKNVRDRVTAYLNTVSLMNNNAHEFNIPLNRQQMADYLNVDRSALSHELSKMMHDGIIKFHKNHFELCTCHQVKELKNKKWQKK